MKFLGNILATVIGIFVFCMICFFGIILIAALFGGGSETVEVKRNSVIELDLSKVNNDYGGKFNYKDFDYFDARHDGLSDVIRAIELYFEGGVVSYLTPPETEAARRAIQQTQPISQRSEEARLIAA